MSQIRAALAQLNLRVGDLPGNSDAVIEWTRKAADRGAHLVAFPEMTLTGYPVEDLALSPSFVESSRASLTDLASRLAAAGLGEVLVLVGYLDRPDEAGPVGDPAGAQLDAAAFLHGGEVVARAVKHHLPNYGVFDERRWFAAGTGLSVVRHHGVDVAAVICEDLWQPGGPVSAAREAGVDVLVSLNASPYEPGKPARRLDLMRRRGAEAGCAVAYVNLIGGQDDLVFDGGSMVVDHDGTLVGRAQQFAEELLIVDLQVPYRWPAADSATAAEVSGVSDLDGAAAFQRRLLVTERCAPPLAAEIAPELTKVEGGYRALVLGLRDYVWKNGFQSAVLGVSGGIDSALVAVLACDALGAEHVTGLSMPSAYSSQHSIDDAAELARRTGMHHRVVPIAPIVEAFLAGQPVSGLAEENLQARVRGTVVMAESNQHGHLALATGNKSELSVGYSTLYGDTVGAFAPLKDVPKTAVWELAEWRNEQARQRGEQPPVPEQSISKPPSAELRPGQLDTDSLPDYKLLDDVLRAHVEDARGRDELIAEGFDPDLVDRIIGLVRTAEYKRRQYPPGPKITTLAFGRDRRIPITNRWR